MVKRLTLENGIKVILEYMPMLETVSTGFFFTTGSSHESEEENGYTHFIEHMLFRGTNNLSSKELVRKIEGVGGSFNAFTSRHMTSFYINIIEKHFERALDTLEDIILNSIFNEDDIEKEKKVIIEELKMSNDTPEEISSNQFFANAYKNSAMGFPIGGSIENIQKITKDKVYNYFKNKFNLNNFIVSIAGKFDVDLAIKKLSNIKLDSAEKNEYENIDFYYNTVVTEKEDLNHIYFSLIKDSYKFNEQEKRYTMNILSDIFGGSSYSKIFQKIREEKALCYNIYSANYNSINTGNFEISGSTSINNYQETLESIYSEFEDIIKNGITEEELEEAKDSYKSNIVFSKLSANFIMNKNARNEIYSSSYMSFDDIYKTIDSINMKNIDEVIEEKLSDKKFFLTAVGPKSTKDISTTFSSNFNIN